VQLLIATTASDKMARVSYDEYGEPSMEAAQTAKGEVGLVGPLVLWLGVPVLGLVMKLLPVLMPSIRFADSLPKIGNYLLYLPSSIVLPLMVGLWLGHRVGSNAKDVKDVPKVVLLAATYVSFIYVVAISIVYFLITYIEQGFATTLPINSFLGLVVGLPVAIVFVLATLMGVLSAARSR